MEREELIIYQTFPESVRICAKKGAILRYIEECMSIIRICAVVFFMGLQTGFSAVVDDIPTETPSEVLYSFMDLGNAGRYLEARKLIDEVVLARLEGMETLTKSIRAWTKNGSVKKLTILREIIADEKATVLASIEYQDGSLEINDKTVFVFRNGLWRITFH